MNDIRSSSQDILHFFAKTSEPEAIKSREVQELMRELPKWAEFLYDKGVRHAPTPYMSKWHTPSFAKTVDGKKRLESVEDVIHSRGTARGRYTPEITYARVKSWRMLKPIIPVERFHLLNAAWWWALGFQNLAQAFLRPPPDVASEEQLKRAAERKELDRLAAIAACERLPEIAGAAAPSVRTRSVA